MSRCFIERRCQFFVQLFQDSLALTQAQFNAVGVVKVLLQALSGRYPFRSSGRSVLVLQFSHQGSPLLAGELRRAASRRVIAQSVQALKVERVHPALDGARIGAEPLRHFKAAAPLRDQQDAVQAM